VSRGRRLGFAMNLAPIGARVQMSPWHTACACWDTPRRTVASPQRGTARYVFAPPCCLNHWVRKADLFELNVTGCASVLRGIGRTRASRPCMHSHSLNPHSSLSSEWSHFPGKLLRLESLRVPGMRRLITARPIGRYSGVGFAELSLMHVLS
jgi:hypothetical protein